MDKDRFKQNDIRVPHSLSRAVKEIDLVLAYAARKGLDIEKGKIDVLVATKDAINAGGQKLDPKTESKFWFAYTEVVRLIQPVSIGGIKASSGAYGEPVWTLRGRKPMSKARLAVRRYQLISIVSLIILLMVQLYAGIGANNLNGLEGVERQIKEKEQERSELTADLYRRAGSLSLGSTKGVNACGCPKT